MNKPREIIIIEPPGVNTPTDQYFNCKLCGVLHSAGCNHPARPSLDKAERQVKEAEAEIEQLRAERDELTGFIERRGYRRCDIPACNCGSFHGGQAEERLTEIQQQLTALREAVAPFVVTAKGMEEVILDHAKHPNDPDRDIIAWLGYGTPDESEWRALLAAVGEGEEARRPVLEGKSVFQAGREEELTFDEYKIAVESYREANPKWRLGQAAFNVLLIFRPDLSEQIRATPLDPFHSINILPKFYEWVERNWDVESFETKEKER